MLYRPVLLPALDAAVYLASSPADPTPAPQSQPPHAQPESEPRRGHPATANQSINQAIDR